MGEMAEYYADQELYRYLDPGDEENEWSPQTCRYCGRTDLHWEPRGDQWRLCDNRGVHRCKVRPLPTGRRPIPKPKSG